MFGKLRKQLGIDKWGHPTVGSRAGALGKLYEGLYANEVRLGLQIKALCDHLGVDIVEIDKHHEVRKREKK